jgi:methylenetetrahydrofolate--tRNA-(uracil-5-)-methyltransferase
MRPRVTVVGAGLAGAECAFQLAQRGVAVALVEQKPLARSAAHQSDGFAELVCSNSFRAGALTNAVGLLKEEMRRAGSLIMAAAGRCAVPAGGALAVDREAFSAEVTRQIRGHPLIELSSEIVTAIPPARPLVLATGPLTGGPLADHLARAIGAEHLAYYDAISPIVAGDSIDRDQVFLASRYEKGGDAAYLNCPLERAQYEALVAAILAAETVEARAFEEPRYFEGCLPIEVMAARGPRTLAFGPMKPVGLTDPRTEKRPYAVVQLRREDIAGTAWNLVGFQTRMRPAEQKRVFGLIPGLQAARFERFGSVHRNTFVCAPRVLDDALSLRALPGVYLTGQLTGVEGYVESAAIGLYLGITLAARLAGNTVEPPPLTTALGALWGFLRRDQKDFQPSNITWSMFAPLPDAPEKNRAARREALVRRALGDLAGWLQGISFTRLQPLPMI